MIRQRLPLPPGCARCPATRAIPCHRADECARGAEPYTKGREVKYFSAESRGIGGSCAWLIPMRYAKPGASQPRVHEAPEWL